MLQFSVGMCWNFAWQTAHAGMHVMNNTLKAEGKKKASLSYSITNTSSSVKQGTGCPLAPGLGLTQLFLPLCQLVFR